jgi:hypothetical protein
MNDEYLGPSEPERRQKTRNGQKEADAEYFGIVFLQLRDML